MRIRFTLAAAVFIGLLTACTPPAEDPTPTPSLTTEAPTSAETETPTPTAETTVDLEAVHIEEARQAILDYTTTLNRVGTTGYTTWATELPPFWGAPEVTNPQAAAVQAAVDAGEYMIGEIKVATLTVTEYTPDPTGSGSERVSVEYCADYSARTLHNADGSVIESEAPPRFVWTGILQHQPDGRWAFVEMTAHLDRSC